MHLYAKYMCVAFVSYCFFCSHITLEPITFGDIPHSIYTIHSPSFYYFSLDIHIPLANTNYIPYDHPSILTFLCHMYHRAWIPDLAAIKTF